MIRKYVNLSKPLQINEFDEYKKPMGWIRLDRIIEYKKDVLSKSEISLIKKELTLMRGGKNWW